MEETLIVAGKCPKCPNEDLDYRAFRIEDALVFYPYTCSNCKFEGEELYHLEFDCHIDGKTKEPVE